MFFDIGPLEMIALVALAVVLFGPDKLPQAAANAARFLRQFREFTQNARDDLKKELGPEFSDLDLADLHPKTFVRKNLLGDGDGISEELGELRGLREDLNRDLRVSTRDLAGPRISSPVRDTPEARIAPGERPPFDADAT